MTDGGSIDSLLAAHYQAISFNAGARADIPRLRALFLPQAIFIPPKGAQPNEPPAPLVMGLEEYLRRFQRVLEQRGHTARGFHEREVARQTRQFGRLAYVLSAFEARFSHTDAAPFARGLAHCQLVHDRGRWWCANLAWELERPEDPIPMELFDQP